LSVPKKIAKPSDERWMEKALAQARLGEALAHPNPMVGAVVIRDGRVAGQGFHTYDGLRHAEILAIESAGSRVRGSTLYLNLEPCCHAGRTGPCTEAIIAAGIRRVVASMPDPNPLVSGKGFRRLRRAGIEVVVGPGEQEALRLNESFAMWIRSHRPLVTLKAAATLDGQLSLASPRARPRAEERWISSEISRARVQAIRHVSDAVLTGIGTILADDPLLTDRTGLPRRRRLLRVVLDSRLRLPIDSRIVRTAEDDVLVFTLRSPESLSARRLAERGVRVARVAGRGGHIDPAAVFAELGRQGILSVMVEAGARINGALLAQGLVDKLMIFYAPRVLGRETVPLARTASGSVNPLAALQRVQVGQSGPDFVVEGYLRDVYRDH
jgi:diaminohydroxyphosphoribosylaminopyrimidine deaminase/5-amino-6-(5-phosphoribosylamino)uracil reductase